LLHSRSPRAAISTLSLHDALPISEYDEAIRLTATLEAWGERLATARPVPLSANPLTGMKTGGALALEGGGLIVGPAEVEGLDTADRKSTRLNSSHVSTSYAVFCLK